MKVQNKICGLTALDAVRVAVTANADAIGLVFYSPSPRYIAPLAAQKLVAAIPPFVSVVGLFVNPTLQELNEVCEQVCIDVIQFHGEETPDECQSLARHTGKRWYKALAVKPEMGVADIVSIIKAYVDAGSSAILLDAWHPTLKGGTGQTFDWSLVVDIKQLLPNVPIILAGGLTPDNVAEAVAQTQPYAVDVSGGVEQVDGMGKPIKGKKDAKKIQDFIAALS